MSQKQRKGTSVQTTHREDSLEARFEQIEEYALYPSSEFLNTLHDMNPEYVGQILQDYRDEKNHRHKLENSQFQETIRINTAHMQLDNRKLDLFSRGQWFGLTLALGLVFLAGFAIYWHEPWVAGTAITAIVGILIVYVLRQKPNNSA